ncbi:helix-turn-helix transcriptional regulator [Cytobacillus praedii]|uniref:helix-turn-helix domain-containing protein n=1 Tax=Cytobacillus praedii TaxID=1742358 RepID=UPI002E1FAA97|nr:helix-turn-helix transcriptional regulator [Cytobacillus praedii]
MPKMSIGEIIKELRGKKNWSLRELEKRTGINYSVLSRIESGKRPVTDQELNLFADLFDITTDYLLGRSTEPDLSAEEDKKVTEETMRYMKILESLTDDERKEFELKIIEYASFLRSQQKK